MGFLSNFRRFLNLPDIIPKIFIFILKYKWKWSHQQIIVLLLCFTSHSHFIDTYPKLIPLMWVHVLKKPHQHCWLSHFSPGNTSLSVSFYIHLFLYHSHDILHLISFHLLCMFLGNSFIFFTCLNHWSRYFYIVPLILFIFSQCFTLCPSFPCLLLKNFIFLAWALLYYLFVTTRILSSYVFITLCTKKVLPSLVAFHLILSIESFVRIFLLYSVY